MGGGAASADRRAVPGDGGYHAATGHAAVARFHQPHILDDHRRLAAGGRHRGNGAVRPCSHPGKVLGQKAPSFKRVLAIISAVLGACIAIYTGILLCVLLNHPLWNTPLLPVLFIVSAFDTGIALVCLYLCMGKPLGETEASAISKPIATEAAAENSAPAARQASEDAAALAKMAALLERCSIGLIAAEALVLAALLLMTSSAEEAGALSVWVLIAGPLAVPFWAVLIAAGLAVPFALELLQLKGKHAKWMAPTAPLLILVGGCALRFLILYAGLPLAM